MTTNNDENEETPVAVPMNNLMGERPFRLEEKGTHIKLTLHGFFTAIEENTKIIEDLYEASNQYSSVEVWVNSDGGTVGLLIEILEALKQFETVVTISNASAFSAGAMIWAFGDIRVTSPYATIGFHRESYGFYGKTDQHSDLLEHQKKIYPILLEETCGHILTDEQKEKARVTELYFTGKDMIDGDLAISYDSYKQGDNILGYRLNPIGTVFSDNEKNTLIMVDEHGLARHISDIENHSPYQFMLYDYIVSNEVRVLYDASDEYVHEKKSDFEKLVNRFHDMMNSGMQEEFEEEVYLSEEQMKSFIDNLPDCCDISNDHDNEGER